MKPAVLICILFLSALLLGCRAKQNCINEYVYIDRTDTISSIKWRIDSVNVRDSIVTFIKGDTVQIEKWHTAFRDRLRIDTVEKVKTETVFRTRTETQIKEINRLLWWQKALMYTGALALILAVCLIGRRLEKKL